MKKMKVTIVLLFSLLIISGCGVKTQKLKSVSYELTDIPGTTSTITLEYDEQNIIQKVVTETTASIKESGQSKDLYKKNLLTYKNLYKNIEGVKFSSNLSEEKMTEKTEIITKEVPEEKLEILFPATTKNDKVFLDDYIKSLESIGYQNAE